METAFLFNRRTWQNKFGAAEEPVHKDRGAAGQRSLSMEAQAVYNPECTVEGLCHPWSPSLQLVRGAGGEQSLCVVLPCKRSHTQETALAIPDLPIYPYHLLSPREYEGAVDFTAGSTWPSFLCAW